MSAYSLLERHSGPLLDSYTSADVMRESRRAAAWLRANGVGVGDRVAIDLKNGLHACAALFGALRLGAITVACSSQWTPQQAAYVFGDSGAKALITNELRAKQLGTALPVMSAWDGPLDDGEVFRDADAPAMLMYTSGSTARPKGVVHPHRNLIAFGEIVAGYLENTAADRLLWVLGWNFGYGLSQLLTMLVAGGSLIVPASMMPADIYNAHVQHRATGLAQVPFGWEQLVGYLERSGKTLDGLRYITNAGDGPTLALLDRIERAIPNTPMILMYGQTECFRTTYVPASQYAAKRGAMGYAIPGVTATIDPETGELLHSGALVANGYWNAPEATAKKFSGSTLRTGDLVRQDDDGCFWYVARSELMLKSSGFRFSPREIEEALCAHADVREAAVFGIPDPQLGQQVHAAVVVRNPVEANALLAHLRPLLPRYMLPSKIHFVDALPRNANGKLHLDALRALS